MPDSCHDSRTPSRQLVLPTVIEKLDIFRHHFPIMKHAAVTLTLGLSFLFCTLARAADSTPQTNADPIRIVCIGDSITQGGKRDRMEYTYRWPLFGKLIDAGVKFDFIGSKQKGLHEDATWPADYQSVPFDPDHEGVYGIKTQAALDRLPAAMEQWPAAPDIALIHLGFNDQKAPDPIVAVQKPLREMISLLRAKNPKMIIFLGQIGLNQSPEADRIQAAVSDLCNELNTPESPVLAVNHFEGWNENPKSPDSDTFDWAHPNPQGQEKMATHWFAVMKPYLKTP